jgi:serine/threonine protein kinase/lipoprotein NlpI
LDAPFFIQEFIMSGSALNSPSARRSAPLTQQLSPFPGGASSLVSRLAEEMAQRWHEGEHPLAEEYLAQYPELCGQPDAVVRLIYEEICLRQANGQETASMEVVQRFPQWREQLEDILCRPFPKSLLPPRLPEVGESLGGFHLIAELGHGIRGRVFLASQPALADRAVVLKITSCDGGEHLSLARLQHTHIVPLYSVQDILDRNLRILCMPYFGGATLTQIEERLRDKNQGENGKALDQLSGLDLLEALDQDLPAESHSVPARGPCRQLMTQLSYVRAICWIGSCLADALEYAHERGLVHLDLKPSNVLLAADGQPMLLDFHLAQKPLLPNGPPPSWLGGTPAYMSPEQKSAVAAMKQGRSVDTPVDGRSDIYSLGVLLDEALGGYLRKSASNSQSPETSRPKYRVSPLTPGLEDLIGKCLRPEPASRYPTAAALAADLRRYLGDLPLHGVSNRSWSERWRKWRRRRPYALTLYFLTFAFLAAAAAAGGSAYIQLRHRFAESHQNLIAGQEQITKRDWEGAIRSLQHGLGLVESLPFSGDLQQDLASQLHLARENKAASVFHLLADRIRVRSVADSLTDRDLRDLDDSCRAACNSIHLIAQRLGDLKEEDRQSIRRDFLDLAVLGANLRVRLASENEIREAREGALQVLEEAEETFGPNSVIETERQLLANALGLVKKMNGPVWTPDAQPEKAWEFCARGRSLMQAGKLEAAAREFKSAIHLEPGGLWPNYYEGICTYRLGRPKEALPAFSVCVGAAGQGTDRTVKAQILFDRALAYSGVGADREAFEDYTRALELDSTMGKSSLNRGLLYFKFKNYNQAIDDLNVALANSVPPAVVHYNLALIYQAQNQRDAAMASARRVLEYEPNHKEAQTLVKQMARQSK